MAYSYRSYIYDEQAGQWTDVIADNSIDYNKIDNQPVRNLCGKTPEQFINLSGLDYGRYVISGYMKYDSSDEVFESAVPVDAVVLQDDQGRKVLTYPSIEDGVCVTNIVTYENGLVISHTKQAPGVSYWQPMN